MCADKSPFKPQTPLSPEREARARQIAAKLLAAKAMKLKERREADKKNG